MLITLTYYKNPNWGKNLIIHSSINLTNYKNTNVNMISSTRMQYFVWSSQSKDSDNSFWSCPSHKRPRNRSIWSVQFTGSSNSADNSDTLVSCRGRQLLAPCYLTSTLWHLGETPPTWFSGSSGDAPAQGLLWGRGSTFHWPHQRPKSCHCYLPKASAVGVALGNTLKWCMCML